MLYFLEISSAEFDRFVMFSDMMKRLLPPFFALLLSSHCMAFDPAGPPPNRKTIEWTVSHLSNVVVPIVNFDKTATLGECIDFLKMSLGAPPAYRVEIDGGALGEARLLAAFPVGLQARDLKLIDALAKIADAVQANLVIEEGKVRLIPMTPAGREAPQSKPAPASK